MNFTPTVKKMRQIILLYSTEKIYLYIYILYLNMVKTHKKKLQCKKNIKE